MKIKRWTFWNKRVQKQIITTNVCTNPHSHEISYRSEQHWICRVTLFFCCCFFVYVSYFQRTICLGSLAAKVVISLWKSFKARIILCIVCSVYKRRKIWLTYTLFSYSYTHTMLLSCNKAILVNLYEKQKSPRLGVFG